MNNLEDIAKLITGNLEENQKKEVFSAINLEEESKAIYRKAKVAWAFMSSTQKMSDYQLEMSYRKLQSRISPRPWSRLIPSSLLRYAASLILLVGLSAMMFYLGQKKTDGLMPEKYTSVIAGNGQISKVVLPDSSVVWLNSESTLTYNSRFSQNNRHIRLDGQAYFDVKPGKLPLVVSCGDLQVKVLGTRFDVCAYPEQNSIQVFLESGKVELLSSQIKAISRVLNPGELADYHSVSGQLQVKPVSASGYLSWKEGKLIFQDTPMENVIQQLERKFRVDIRVENPQLYKSVFTARFEYESLTEILDYIQFSCQVNYELVEVTAGEMANVIFK